MVSDYSISQIIDRMYAATKSNKIVWNKLSKVIKFDLCRQIPHLIHIELENSYYFQHKEGFFYVLKMNEVLLLCVQKNSVSLLEPIDTQNQDELMALYSCILESKATTNDFIKSFMEDNSLT